MSPAFFSSACTNYEQSSDYLDMLRSTRCFYAQFNKLLFGILLPSRVSYANAYDVSIFLTLPRSTTYHPLPSQNNQISSNTTQMCANQVEITTARCQQDLLAALRSVVLSSSNRTQPSHLKELSNSLWWQAPTTRYSNFFGLANLTILGSNNNFTRLPNYASSIVFEPFSLVRKPSVSQHYRS